MEAWQRHPRRGGRLVALVRRSTISLAGAVLVSLGVSNAASADPPLTPLSALQQAITIVKQLAGSAHDPRAVQQLTGAATALTGATDATSWIDPSHVVAPSYGTTMFTDTSTAVHDLFAVPFGSVSALPLIRSVVLIVGADQGVAYATAQEADGGKRLTRPHGGSPLDAGRLRDGNASALARRTSLLTDGAYGRWLDAYAAINHQAIFAITSVAPRQLAADAQAALQSPTLGIFTPSLQKRQPPLQTHGRPELFLQTWEFCPFCATDSWGFIAGLSQFGSFKHLQIVSSDPSEGVSLSGFTFRNIRYSSPTVSVVALEQFSSVPAPGAPFPAYQVLQPPTPAEQQLISAYNTFGGAPFADLGNIFTGYATVSPVDLLVDPNNLTSPVGLTWSQIAAAVRDPTSVAGQAVGATAEMYTAEICEVTSQRPASVCNASIVQQYEAGLDTATGGGYCPGSGTVATASRAVPARRIRVGHHRRRARPPRARIARCSV